MFGVSGDSPNSMPDCRAWREISDKLTLTVIQLAPFLDKLQPQRALHAQDTISKRRIGPTVRGLKDVRQSPVDVGAFRRTHGSWLFTAARPRR